MHFRMRMTNRTVAHFFSFVSMIFKYKKIPFTREHVKAELNMLPLFSLDVLSVRLDVPRCMRRVSMYRSPPASPARPSQNRSFQTLSMSSIMGRRRGYAECGGFL